jgi:hypothetical protein
MDLRNLRAEARFALVHRRGCVDPRDLDSVKWLVCAPANDPVRPAQLFGSSADAQLVSSSEHSKHDALGRMLCSFLRLERQDQLLRRRSPCCDSSSAPHVRMLLEDQLDWRRMRVLMECNPRRPVEVRRNFWRHQRAARQVIQMYAQGRAHPRRVYHRRFLRTPHHSTLTPPLR